MGAIPCAEFPQQGRVQWKSRLGNSVCVRGDVTEREGDKRAGRGACLAWGLRDPDCAVHLGVRSAMACPTDLYFFRRSDARRSFACSRPVTAKGRPRHAIWRNLRCKPCAYTTLDTPVSFSSVRKTTPEAVVPGVGGLDNRAHTDIRGKRHKGS